MKYQFYLSTTILACILIASIAIRIYFFQVSTQYLPATADEILTVYIARDIASGSVPLLFYGAPYQFPLESYLLAPFVSYLPQSAFGARFPFAVLSMLAVLGFLALLSKTSTRANRLPGAALLLLPSCYVLTLQTAYFIPEHTATMHFAWILPALSLLLAAKPQNALLAVLLGATAGLALATHLLSAPLVCAVTLVCCISDSMRNAIRNTCAYMLGLCLGLIPYILTYSAAKEMAAQVTGRHGISDAITRLFSNLLPDNTTVVLGFDAALFPDHQHWGGVIPWILPYARIILLLGLLFLTFVRLRAIVFTLMKRSWPRMGIDEVMLGTVWACLIAAVLSKRAEPGEYRYFLPIAWCFPFLVTQLYSLAKHRGIRFVISSSVIALCALQVVHTFLVAQEWKTAFFREMIAGSHSLTQVVRYLDANEIDTCYSGFWYAYRFRFETNERIKCYQAYNERFTGWPLPLRPKANQEKEAAYILTNTRHARLKASEFLDMLRHHHIAATVTQIFPFFVFHNFSYDGVSHSQRLSPENIRLTTSDGSENAEALLDGDRSTVWQSHTRQSPFQSITLSLSPGHRLHRIRIRFPDGKRESWPKYKLEISANGQTWRTVVDDMRAYEDRLVMGKKFPHFASDNHQDHSFPPQEVQSIRLTIVYAKSEYFWEIGDLLLYEEIPTLPRK